MSIHPLNSVHISKAPLPPVILPISLLFERNEKCKGSGSHFRQIVEARPPFDPRCIRTTPFPLYIYFLSHKPLYTLTVYIQVIHSWLVLFYLPFGRRLHRGCTESEGLWMRVEDYDAVETFTDIDGEEGGTKGCV